MFLTILKLIGYTLFLIQFGVIMAYKYYKHLKGRVLSLLWINSKPIDARSPMQKVHPHVFSTTDDILTAQGYQVQSLDIQTQDGYILTVWHINSRDPNKRSIQPYPVLLMHGLLDCGISWFVHENKLETLPYMLAERGFEVWIGNNRGTRYSNKGNERDGYWEFSFDELAKYDVPALINGVLKHSGKEKLIYIGHSQGSTQLIASLSEDPYLQHKIALKVGLGTVVTLHTYSGDCILNLLERLPVLQVLRWLGFKTMLSIPSWLVKCVAILTYNTDFYPNAGLYVINFVCGFPRQSNIARDRLGVIFSHEPGGTSIKNVMQWLHTSVEKQLVKFDYGQKENMLKYGQNKPPKYDFEKLKQCRFKTLLFRGTIDSVVSETDFQHLTDKFDPQLVDSHHIEGYHHLDYVWAKDTHNKVHPLVLDACLKTTFQTD